MTPYLFELPGRWVITNVSIREPLVGDGKYITTHVSPTRNVLKVTGVLMVSFEVRILNTAFSVKFVAGISSRICCANCCPSISASVRPLVVWAVAANVKKEITTATVNCVAKRQPEISQLRSRWKTEGNIFHPERTAELKNSLRPF